MPASCMVVFLFLQGLVANDYFNIKRIVLRQVQCRRMIECVDQASAQLPSILTNGCGNGKMNNERSM